MQGRGTRRLEKARRRNLEVLWLMKRLHPDCKTIASFRQQNSTATRAAYGSLVGFCCSANLLRGRLIAIDGSKFEVAAGTGQTLPRNRRATKRRVSQHFYAAALQQSQARPAANPELMAVRMAVAECPFAHPKQNLGLRRFQWGIEGARPEMGLGALAYNLHRMIREPGVKRPVEALLPGETLLARGNGWFP